jgi:hypothetical protein
MHYWRVNHYIVSYDAGINTSEVKGAENIAIDTQGRLNSVIGHRAKCTGAPIYTTTPGFQVRGRGAHLKKMRRAEGGAKIYFFPILGGVRAGYAPPPPGSAPALTGIKM